MRRSGWQLYLAALAAAVTFTWAFYLPGIAPVDYERGAELLIYAYGLQSPVDQVPFSYYSLPFCKREGEAPEKGPHLNLGEILMGERNELTNLKAFMRADTRCAVYCQQHFTSRQIKAFRDKIKEEYVVYLSVDNMPVVLGENFTARGLPLGQHISGGGLPQEQVILWNHYELEILYHKPSFSASDFHFAKPNQELYRVVGFKGMVQSKNYEKSNTSGDAVCPEEEQPTVFMLLNNEPQGQSVTFTYSLKFSESSIEWSTRWDSLLTAFPGYRRVQWFSILNSIAITIFLSALVAVVLFRTVYLDFARYNNLDDAAEAQEETGWKQVHADVFRAPIATGILCVLCGTGAQLCLIFVVTLFFAVLGLLSPAYRGGLLSSLLIFWVMTSVVSGYVSARMYAGLYGTQKRLVTMGSCFGYSTFAFTIFFGVNLVLWVVQSSAAVHFGTLVLLLLLWFGVSTPINVFGAFLGHRKQPYDLPTKTSTFYRPIPDHGRAHAMLFVLFGGLLPFACVFIQLSFILNSLWQDEVFYMFGFLLVVFVILAITCAEVSIVITYFFLSNENYHWWWRAYFAPAASGFYVLIYSLIFLQMRPTLRDMHFASFVLYMSYMFLIAVSFAILTGFIGFEAAFTFVTKMFASVKID